MQRSQAFKNIFVTFVGFCVLKFVVQHFNTYVPSNPLPGPICSSVGELA